MCSPGLSEAVCGKCCFLLIHYQQSRPAAICKAKNVCYSSFFNVSSFDKEQDQCYQTPLNSSSLRSTVPHAQERMGKHQSGTFHHRTDRFWREGGFGLELQSHRLKHSRLQSRTLAEKQSHRWQSLAARRHHTACSVVTSRACRGDTGLSFRSVEEENTLGK